MQINTEPKEVELPEDHPLIEELNDAEAALYYSSIEEAWAATEEIIAYYESVEEFDPETAEIEMVQTRLQDALLLVEIIQELGALRHKADTKSAIQRLISGKQAHKEYFDHIETKEGSDE